MPLDLLGLTHFPARRGVSGSRIEPSVRILSSLFRSGKNFSIIREALRVVKRGSVEAVAQPGFNCCQGTLPDCPGLPWTVPNRGLPESGFRRALARASARAISARQPPEASLLGSLNDLRPDSFRLFGRKQQIARDHVLRSAFCKSCRPQPARMSPVGAWES